MPILSSVSGRESNSAIAARNLVLVTRFEDLAHEKDAVDKAHADVSEALAQLKKLAETTDAAPEGRQLIATIEETEKLYAPVALGIVALALEGNTRRPSSA